MSEKLVRIYKKFHIDEIKEYVLVCGDLSANCSKCNAVGIKTNADKCPECSTQFKYVTFRNVKGNMPKIHKLIDERSDLIFIDYDDFKRATGSLKIEGLFND